MIHREIARDTVGGIAINIDAVIVTGGIGVHIGSEIIEADHAIARDAGDSSGVAKNLRQRQPVRQKHRRCVRAAEGAVAVGCGTGDGK